MAAYVCPTHLTALGQRLLLFVLTSMPLLLQAMNPTDVYTHFIPTSVMPTDPMRRFIAC